MELWIIIFSPHQNTSGSQRIVKTSFCPILSSLRPRYTMSALALFALLFILPPAEEAFHEHRVKTMIQGKRLTEIFGGTPGPRLALAQGEAALSAQETPHPCPACGRARSSQPPFTPNLEVNAAKECPRTPSCCSSPELTASKSLYPPARQIKCTKKVTSVGYLANASPCSQSENQQFAAEERKAGGEGRASESQALHPG